MSPAKKVPMRVRVAKTRLNRLSRLVSATALSLAFVFALSNNHAASASATQPTVLLPPPNEPVVYTGSLYYVSGSVSSLYSEGKSHGSYANDVGSGGMIILDFGCQDGTSSTLPVDTSSSINFSQIYALTTNYADGYASVSSAPLLLLIGTNSDCLPGSGSNSYATSFANLVNEVANATPSQVYVGGAIDIEPSYDNWQSGPALQWAGAYASVAGEYNAGYWDYGAGYIAGNWTYSEQYQVFYGDSLSQAAPELYCPGDINDYPPDSMNGSHIYQRCS